jgi:hypothetical protein
MAKHNKKQNKELCEICEGHDHQWALVDTLSGDKIYLVCSTCLIPLVNYNLTPKHGLFCSKNGHSKSEYLLHSDFYDNNGNALQPF